MLSLKRVRPRTICSLGKTIDLPYVHVADEDIAGDLSDILEETEVECLVLEPRDLQVAVDVSTVGVPVSKIPVVMLLVGRNW